MAWEARSGLKRLVLCSRSSKAIRLNGLGSPFGIETGTDLSDKFIQKLWLNGLGSPFGIETRAELRYKIHARAAKWPGKPVRD